MNKLLDINYLAARIQQITRGGEVRVRRSDREGSNTLYAVFYIDGWEEITLRVSVHRMNITAKNEHIINFIVADKESKKENALFERTVKNCMRMARTRFFYKKMKKVEKEQRK